MSAVTLSLENKVALITGGSRGIGAATVRLFRQAGARVAFNYRSAQSTAEALAAECGGPKLCAAFAQDLSTPEDGRTLVRRTVDHFGRIDILVANHGVWEAQDAPIATMSDTQWRTTLAINLDSVFGLIQTAAGAMQQQARTSTPTANAGNIVLVSSTAGQRGEAFHADYAASKGAVISMTKGLATELAPHGIRVNCVAPGWVRTDMCTPLAGFMTGEIVNVNGGAVLVG